MRKTLPLLLLLLLLAACSGTASAQNDSDVTGFLEADTLDLAPETGGRITTLLVDEGDTVAAGQLLARLDGELLRLQIAQADADVAAARARLAQLNAGVSSQEIALAQARLAQAQIVHQTAKEALQDAILLRDTPQELDVRIAQAQGALREARAQADAAQHQAQAADWEAEMWQNIVHDLSQKQRVTLPNGQVIEVDAPAEQKHEAQVQWQLASNKAWQAWQQVAQAQAASKQAQVALNDLKSQRQNRQQAEVQVVAATNASDAAEASVRQAQAALDALQAGPDKAQIQAAEAAVAQAQAAREALAVRASQQEIYAPCDGIISARYFSAGEIIAPGQKLLTLMQPQQLHMTIYLPASRIGSIAPGQTFPLSVESAPQQHYQAQVIAIADTPEFTMRQSQNIAERAAVVYAVTLRVPTPDTHLRPGLPAVITLHTPESP